MATPFDEMERVDVFGASMAYRTSGTGDPVVLLHGNPTSSYLWRAIIGYLDGLGRCVAPDLVGMGRSGPAHGRHAGYRYIDHRRHLDRLFDLLAITDRVTLVGHDWGGVLAIDWARRHADRVRGIAYLETLVAPVTWAGENAPDPAVFRRLRSPEGESMVIEHNFFVEAVLPAGTMRTLSPAEMAMYRTPYLEPGERRRPTLTWAREIPIDGEPADVHDIVSANAAWMAASPVPKLFLNGDPGALLTGPLRDLCRTWPNQTEVTVPGLHFLPEDSPDLIGRAIAGWLEGL